MKWILYFILFLQVDSATYADIVKRGGCKSTQSSKADVRSIYFDSKSTQSWLEYFNPSSQKLSIDSLVLTNGVKHFELNKISIPPGESIWICGFNVKNCDFNSHNYPSSFKSKKVDLKEDGFSHLIDVKPVENTCQVRIGQRWKIVDCMNLNTEHSSDIWCKDVKPESQRRECLKFKHYSSIKLLTYVKSKLNMYNEIDNNDGHVRCIYGGKKVYVGYGNEVLRNAYNGRMNIEHIIPQSYFDKESKALVDLHNMYPSDVNINKARSNYRYGKVMSNFVYFTGGGVTKSISNVDRFSMLDSKNKLWEPPLEMKGDIARSIAYVRTMYHNIGSSILSNSGLKNWSRQDPVSKDEISRNKKIFSIQGNYNPFVKNPSLVDEIFK